MVKAVIFDMDGTLIDSEKLYRKYWPMAFAKFGYEMSDERALEIRSLGRPFGPKQYRAWYGEDLDYSAIRTYRTQLIEDDIRQNGLQAKPGTTEILTFLKERGVIRAIATATDPERTGRYLKLAGLDGWFDTVVSATMVAEGKPSPDVYRYACETLGLSPDECLAVEDAPNGIRSAYRAGLRVVMVPDQTEPDEELRKLLFARVDTLADIRNLDLWSAQ